MFLRPPTIPERSSCGHPSASPTAPPTKAPSARSRTLSLGGATLLIGRSIPWLFLRSVTSRDHQAKGGRPKELWDDKEGESLWCATDLSEAGKDQASLVFVLDGDRSQ